MKYTEIRHISGCARMCNSIIGAICVSPILMMLSTIMIGCNERHDACYTSALEAGKDAVQEISGTNSNEGGGGLVFFSGAIQPGGVNSPKPNLGPYLNYPFNFSTTGIEVTVMVKQCVEEKHTHEELDTKGGGGSTEITTYTYKLDWSSFYLDDTYYHTETDSWQENCGAKNTWDNNLPAWIIEYASSVKILAMTISPSFIRQIPLSTTKDLSFLSGYGKKNGFQPSSEAGTSFIQTGGSTGRNGIGQAKMTIKIFDWSQPEMSVLGYNNDGLLDEWTAPDSWMCSGYQLGSIKLGTYTVDSFFKTLQEEASMVTWVLRILAFLMFWVAFMLCFGPLGVGADCIPCCGPCLGDAVEKIACCISCCPGFGCACCLSGMVWMVMRPLIGIPMVIFCCCVWACFIFLVMKLKDHASGGPGFKPVIDSLPDAIQKPLKATFPRVLKNPQPGREGLLAKEHKLTLVGPLV